MKFETEWNLEELHLAQVIDAWATEIDARQKMIGQLRAEARKSNPRDISAGALLYHVASNNASTLDKLQQATKPYFGRIDFLDIDENERLHAYIGEVSIRGAGAQNTVFDWRAPLCSLFYRGKGGRTFYSAPGGNVSGDLELKRHFEIEESALKSMYDAFGGTAVSAGQDEMLVSLLNRSSSANMRKIVQSIQEEQDEVIRAAADVLVVQGPAGSGKTVVALHRAAYLLYQLNEQRAGSPQQAVTAQGMLVFSPNRIFSSYIANVLPDLQEDEIRQTIFELHLREQLIERLSGAGTMRIESKDEYDERLLAYGLSTSIAENRWLASSQLLRAQEEFVAAFDDGIETSIRNLAEAAARGEELVDMPPADDLIREYRQRRGEVSLLDRYSDVMAYVDRARQDAIQSLANGGVGPQRRESLERQRTRLVQLHRDLARERTQLGRRSLPDLYGAFWQSQCVRAEHATLAEDRRIYGEPGSLTIPYEDVLPMICLSGLFRGFPQFRDIIHAIVDEAQEYSPLHFEYLKRCLPRSCRLTIVGDLNQTSNAAVGLANYENLEAVFPRRVTRLNLTHSYRSSREISELSARILGSGSKIESVRRTRERPRVVEVPVAEEVPAAIVREVRRLTLMHPTVAVIAKTTQACDQLRAPLLREWPNLQQLSRDSASIPYGVLIVPLHLAKGLEFDAVVVADADAETYGDPGDQRLLYIACTRALHGLALCYSGNRTPFLPDAPEDLFEHELVRDAAELLYIYDYEVLTTKRVRVTTLARTNRTALTKLRGDVSRLSVEIDSEMSQTLTDMWNTIQEYWRLAPGASRSELDAISDHLESRGWRNRINKLTWAMPDLLAQEEERRKREQAEREASLSEL